ncbi:hypothetical protein N7539_004808 [Penicillium diatomitis]|uniref:Xylanolytic transcriptional activator regulatory domain-containing protein n=1 Tax=Penicillium diatomitis TaxID=2819901 RepID=A0A9W9X5Q7_9EURO|nr:uncharacterized protein N7539_004808 [Penicillium diatomitis]KAJ5484820.1 hypothetical protein N7539_004808 [Penicillium diatomitis]
MNSRHKPRPTNRRISQLEQENATLRQKFIEGQRSAEAEGRLASSAPGVSNSPSLLQSQAESSSPNNAVSSAGVIVSTPNGALSRTEVPEGAKNSHGLSLYHGPTSIVYDDTIQSTVEDDGTNPIQPTTDVEYVRNMLFAQTARQRQFEPLNLAYGKLDFDGLDPDLGMHLLTIYWSRQLYTAQIIYRPLFMRDMACGGPYFSKLLLNAIMFTVSKHCSRPELRSDPDDVTTAGWRFRQRFTELLRDSFDKSEIATIQALLIMSNSLFSRCDERSLSWLYAGNAFNMIIDLGLHVLPSSNQTTAEELELRKRVLWGAYTIDKIQCLLQGRPPLLRHVNFKVSLEFLDEYDELDAFKSLTYSATSRERVIPSFNVSLLTKLCQLSIISERVLCELYSETRPGDRGRNPRLFTEISTNLEGWRSSLPRQLDYLSFPHEAVLLPQAFCLLALSNALMILSQRPLFTSASQVTTHDSSAAYEAVSKCTTAANQIVQILRDYSQHFSITSAPYMLSYATYIGATIHVRIAAQKGHDSTSFNCLLVCRSVLQEHVRLYAAAAKAMANLDKLIAHHGVKITGDGLAEALGMKNTSQYQVREHMSGPELPSTLFQSTQIGSPQLNCGLSDLDLEAIAQSFRLDSELHYLMHPVGI